MAMQSCAVPQPAGAGPWAEAIDIVRIRLSAGPHAVVVLGEFRAADRLLVDWARQQRGGGCEVEVTFLDGYVFRGRYDYRNDGGRPSVSQFVRRTLQLQADQHDGTAAGPSRYLVEGC